MPRKVRIQFAGAVYHDREMFLRTLGEACERTGRRVHAYVLMSNHYHLLLVLGMLDQASDRRQKKRPGDAVLWPEHGTAEAERIAVRALERLKLKPEDLGQTRKSDERKIQIGALLRKVTTVSNGWIAQRLSMGDPTRVSRSCSRQRWIEDANFRRKLDQLEKMSILED
jgi:hypothetical protein